MARLTQGVFVVAIADVTAEVLLVRATVDNALSIVSVAILRRAASLEGLVGVFHVDEDGTTSTSVVAAGAAAAANGNSVAELLVGNNVVGAAGDTIGEVHPANISPDVEGLGVPWAQLEQLLHVEELDAVAGALRSDNQGIPDLLDLAPNDGVIVGGQTTEVFELTFLGDLSEGSAVGLANGNKFSATLLVCPTPAATALTDGITKLRVGLEVVEVLA